MDTAIINFHSDTTIRWSCQAGDYVYWFSTPSIFSNPERDLVINDLWEMKNGDFVTITNRVPDMPEWFSFHPTEVCNSLAYKLLDQFNDGIHPDEPIDAPNLWRPKGGDRLAWVGPTRSDIPAKGPILSVIDFRECALVIGDNAQIAFETFLDFGSLAKPEQTQKEIALCQEAIQFVRKMGIPRTFSLDWKIG